MTTKQVNKISEEATRIMKDYPEMTIREAIEKAKEVLKVGD